MSAPLVLLDRDGVINADRADSVRSIAEWEPLPRAGQAIALLNRAGFKVAVVTNQSVVGRGMISQAELDEIHTHMRAVLSRDGAHLDAIYCCTDAPDHATDRRKPAPGMLLQALQDFGADASRTPMVGDALTDLQAASAAGCPRYLVTTGKGRAVAEGGIPRALSPVVVCDDLWAAAQHIAERFA